jgi:hypothetical protein
VRRGWTVLAVLAVAAALLAAAPAVALGDPPQVTITAGPPPITNNPAAHFEFTAPGALAVTCRLDGPDGLPGIEAPCDSPQDIQLAGDGVYVFTVHATNVDGPGEASETFTLDTHAPPAPAITTPAEDAPVRGPDVTVSGTAEAGAGVDISGGATVVGHATATDGTWSATVPLPDGPHTLTAVATDAAGNASPASDPRTVTVDSVAPETTLDSRPPALTNRASATFVVGSSEDGSTFECRLTGPGHADDFATCGATAEYSGLADGDYTFAARATDEAGNTDATPATWAFTVDTTPPSAPTLSGTPATFTFSSEPGATFACALDAEAFVACASPYARPGVPPGAHTLRVHAADAAGNTGPDASLGFSVPAPLPSPPPLSAPPIPLPPAPAPVFHSAVVARPGLADVRVRLPGSARYARLGADRAVPLGTVFDTRRGSVQIVSVPRRGAAPQRASFGGGVFRVTQRGGTTVLTLVGSCRPAHRLTGDGRGAFQVRGRYSSATVRNARWVVHDSCAGTLTRTLQGIVQVRDQVRRRTVLVRAGRRYLARPNR